MYLSVYALTSYLSIYGPCVHGQPANKTLTLGLLIPWKLLGYQCASAIIPAIDEIYERNLLPAYEIKWTWRDSYCEPRKGMRVALELWTSVSRLDALIGPGCSVVCEPVSLLAAAWGIPILAYSCGSSTLSDRIRYPTFSRTQESATGLTVPVDRVMDAFGWKRIGILTSTEELWKSFGEAVKLEMEKNEKKVVSRMFDSTVHGTDVIMEKYEALRQIILDLKEASRIIMVFSYTSDVANVLQIAYDHGMLNGEFVFLTISSHIPSNVDPLLTNGILSINNKALSGPKYDDLMKRIIDEFQTATFANVTHIPANFDPKDILPYAAQLFEAVLLWAYAVNKTLEQGFSPYDGFKVTENTFHLQFQGIDSVITMDGNGERKSDARVYIMQNGQLVVLMDYEVATQEIKKLYKAKDPADWSGIIWYGNVTSVPSDAPSCGWEGELCPPLSGNPRVTFMLVTTVGVVLIITIISAFIGFRRYTLNLALKQIEQLRIEWKDFENVTHIDSVKTNAQTKKGVYLGQAITLKVLDAKTVALNDKSLLVDLRNMSDISHENIAPFIGISTDVQHYFICMAYLSRGSLRDMIEKNKIKLNWDIKVSLIKDVSEGMMYLHKTQIAFHGRLTSHKCVIDKRWVCKITDYGFASLRKTAGSRYSAIETKAERFLWMAPEILHQPLKSHDERRADVYSFAIIMQEIILECGPYGTDQTIYELESILQKLLTFSATPFRPRIPEESCSKEWLKLINVCWEEDPAKRPGFTEVLREIKSIEKGKSLGFVDSMIKRLEIQTTHLEEIVSDRTIELLEEKCKAERILEELIPTNVAESLKIGHTVEPESFDNITCFFSDIVGFTRISAAATPMEIVVMLNCMYTMFDDVAQRFDVYKVATIGDAYMVASGVPIRNGSRHAREICCMALALRDAINHFVIPHDPSENLRMRSGVHSGPCVAGVCGLKMPRYLLFGDTIDIASRMESGGEAMKVHISETTNLLIQDEVTFDVKLRGEMEIKGKGKLVTYWVEHEVKTENIM